MILLEIMRCHFLITETAGLLCTCLRSVFQLCNQVVGTWADQVGPLSRALFATFIAPKFLCQKKIKVHGECCINTTKIKQKKNM